MEEWYAKHATLNVKMMVMVFCGQCRTNRKCIINSKQEIICTRCYNVCGEVIEK